MIRIQEMTLIDAMKKTVAPLVAQLVVQQVAVLVVARGDLAVFFLDKCEEG